MDTGSLFQHFIDMVKAIQDDSARKRVEIAAAQATGYVWGRQDAGESSRDTGYSLDFGYAYGIHAAEYALELSSSRRNIQDAFNSFKAGEDFSTMRHLPDYCSPDGPCGKHEIVASTLGSQHYCKHCGLGGCDDDDSPYVCVKHAQTVTD